MEKRKSLTVIIKGVSNFDAQNPIIGSLLREIDVRKKQTSSSLILKAPNINDVVLKHRFDRLKKTDEPYNESDDDDDDGRGPGPPPSLPNFNFFGANSTSIIPPQDLNEPPKGYQRKMINYLHHHHHIAFLQKKMQQQAQLPRAENKLCPKLNLS